MRTLLMILALLAIVAAGVTAGDEAGKKDKPEKLDGKKLYRDMCKVCHGPDAEAGEYTPMFLIQDQWEQFFTEDYVDTHEDLTFEDEDKTKVLDIITPAMLKAIHEFCIEGAADSEHPMTCG